MSSAKFSSVVRVDWSERIALTASAACVVHCVALPLALAAVPAIAAMLDVPEAAHLWLVATAAPAAAYALLKGRAAHHRGVPIALGLAGFLLLALGLLVRANTRWETMFTIAGSAALILAHLLNWRLRHASCS